MNLSPNVESLALFGSVPRGDADQFSDRDVLLAGACEDQIMRSNLANAGYSPSVYTWPQMEALSRDGSLFLQHIKQEGHVLRDRHGRLNSLLERYRPLVDYRHRIEENLELFEMTRGTPACVSAMGWSFDVLAVAFRNHAILQLANTGRYVFSYPALVAETTRAHGLSVEEAELLAALRRRKRDYRAGFSVGGIAEKLTQTQAVIERVTGAHCLANRHSIEDFVLHQIKSTSAYRHWYYPLRRLEGAYRAMGYTPANASSETSHQIEAIFSKPSPYGGTAIDSVDWIRTNVEATFAVWLRGTSSASEH
ncbi:nucleotidyltransferase domain-containing protein [Acidovorax sp. Root568]|uniref:nucleotidyltransferase domain-containing protein n=1 Tax=Acidovorax sp. Root568 TaxID=1736565 RepID=UPI000A88A8F0|nr:nucleotidyltransferase domain-containing protein [Acidovorax sp. Root568]